MKRFLAGVFALALINIAQASVYFVDLSDAYDRSSALKNLLSEVDVALTAVRSQAATEQKPLQEELEALKTSRLSAEAAKARKRELLLRLAESEKRSALAQQALGAANERASAEVDRVIVAIEQELKQERGAQAILRTQDLLYFKRASAFDLSEELYRRLNQRLPKVKFESTASKQATP
jgi:Skp family chaperone for outer membrane proteins